MVNICGDRVRNVFHSRSDDICVNYLWATGQHRHDSFHRYITRFSRRPSVLPLLSRVAISNNLVVYQL